MEESGEHLGEALSNTTEGSRDHLSDKPKRSSKGRIGSPCSSFFDRIADVGQGPDHFLLDDLGTLAQRLVELELQRGDERVGKLRDDTRGFCIPLLILIVAEQEFADLALDVKPREGIARHSTHDQTNWSSKKSHTGEGTDGGSDEALPFVDDVSFAVLILVIPVVKVGGNAGEPAGGFVLNGIEGLSELILQSPKDTATLIVLDDDFLVAIHVGVSLTRELMTEVPCDVAKGVVELLQPFLPLIGGKHRQIVHRFTDRLVDALGITFAEGIPQLFATSLAPVLKLLTGAQRIAIFVYLADQLIGVGADRRGFPGSHTCLGRTFDGFGPHSFRFFQIVAHRRIGRIHVISHPGDIHIQSGVESFVDAVEGVVGVVESLPRVNPCPSGNIRLGLSIVGCPTILFPDGGQFISDRIGKAREIRLILPSLLDVGLERGTPVQIASCGLVLHVPHDTGLIGVAEIGCDLL